MTQSNAIPVYTRFGETEAYPDVVHCEALSARAPIHDWRIAAHRHMGLVQLFMIEEGAVSAIVDGAEVQLKNGHYLYIPAGCVHQFGFEPGTTGHAISIPTPVLGHFGAAGDDLASALSQPVSGNASETIKTLINALVETSESPGAFRKQRAIGLAHSVLCTLAENHISTQSDAQQKSQTRLQRLDALINAHMAEGWGASDYATEMALSAGHLSRLCRDATGMGAAAYIEGRVIEEARRLLAFTQLPVSEVGYRLGFADPSYFSKRFQKAMKTTPTAYRNQFLS